MTDDPGRCPHCGAYIGVAVAQHAALCELRPKETEPVEHNALAASVGACQCAECCEVVTFLRTPHLSWVLSKSGQHPCRGMAALIG